MKKKLLILIMVSAVFGMFMGCDTDGSSTPSDPILTEFPEEYRGTWYYDNNYGFKYVIDVDSITISTWSRIDDKYITERTTILVEFLAMEGSGFGVINDAGNEFTFYGPSYSDVIYGYSQIQARTIVLSKTDLNE